MIRHFAPVLIAVIVPTLTFASPADDELAAGIRAYQERHWTEAMGFFIQTLNVDPNNQMAHEYIDSVTKQIDQEQKETVEENRTAILTQVSQRLDSARYDNSLILKALDANHQQKTQYQAESEHQQCIMAQMEDHLGHLASANDLTLRVIEKNPTNQEAQQLLSILQTHLRDAILNGKLPDFEISVYKGFYAYGQADYNTALTEWKDARAAIASHYPAEQVPSEIAIYRFDHYQQLAQTHADSDQKEAATRDLFNQGVDLSAKGASTEALIVFRKVALINPEFPGLAPKLIAAEAAAEEERTKQMTASKKQQVDLALSNGKTSLDHGDTRGAKKYFQIALALDPTNPEAKSYLSSIETETQRKRDPKAAQQHYETGLVYYASGRVDDALREWKTTLQLDPNNANAANAIENAQKEVALSKEELNAVSKL